MAEFKLYKRSGGSCKLKYTISVITAILVVGINAEAQYFGRNKPGYKSFNFDVLQSPNFEIYHYLKNDSLIKILTNWSEKWYQSHQKIFTDTFGTKNPIIFYNNHPDFQQTNAISSLIGTGTGGVTESLKNRVIMPVAPSLAQTDHTLGHELVHAFQYNMFMGADTSKRMSINNIPLWMVEGMAEYLSIGSIDPHTAMWMRDALLNKKFPKLEKLSDQSEYFPYRYGHSFWAMAGKTWGDTIIVPLFQKTAQYGFEKAVDTVLKVNEETLSGMWKSATEVFYGQYLKDSVDNLSGKVIISDKNGGRINISPAVSPDGKYIAFFSERDLFTLDLFLVEVSKGKIKRLSSVTRNRYIDDFDYVESTGTWSPDGKKFAFVIIRKGMNRLAILDVSRGKITKELAVPGLASFSNPAWSPDGEKIVVSGLDEGISDLYLYYLYTDEVEKLTSDVTANLHPSWSPDGNSIVFSQEKMNLGQGRKKYSYNLAILDLKNDTIREIDVFKGAYNMDPCFSYDNKSIYFLSDADGFRNLYRYDLESERVFRLTEYMTGISGITSYSPAISTSLKNDLITYNYYFNTKYQIVAANGNDFIEKEADARHVDFDPGTLPPHKHFSANMIDTNLYNHLIVAELPEDSIKIVPYKPKFRLDYISNSANIGLSTGMYRNNMSGSINMLFSDMVGNNQMFASLSLNGEIYDFGGQAAYINQKGRVKWGASLSHIPYLYGNMFISNDTISIDDEPVPVINLGVDYIRMFEDNISLFASYPVSQTTRFEANMASSWYYYRIDRFTYYYLRDGYNIGGKREKLDAPQGSNYQQISLAYVSDNSYFGMTAPMQGSRARLQVEKYFGSVNTISTLVDYRQYFKFRPLSLAFRFYNYGMYGEDAESGIIPPFYLGYPWLIRGYENISWSGNDFLTDEKFNVSRLSGTRIMVANAEIRLPFTGPERLALIKSKWLMTDLNLFFDAGMAWNRENKVTFVQDLSKGVDGSYRFPVLSTGASIRINLFGYLVLEPYYAFPLQNGGFRNGQFGLNFVPGW